MNEKTTKTAGESHVRTGSGVVRELRKQLFDPLGAGIKNTVQETENALYDAMERAGDNESRSDCMENVTEFRAYKQKVVDQFLSIHLASFDAYFSGHAQAGGNKAAETAEPLKPGSLSLLQKDEQEESLLIDTMAGRLSKQYSLELVVMRRRLASLAGAAYGDNILSPLCPVSVAGSLQKALQELKVPVGLRNILYMNFERQVMHGLQRLYVALGTFFQERNVLPDLTVDDVLAEMSAAQRVRQEEAPVAAEDSAVAGQRVEQGASRAVRGSAGTGMGGTGFSATGSAAMDNQVSGSTPFQQQIEQQIGEINQLLGNYRNSLGVVLPSGSRMLDSFAPPGASQNYRQDQIMQALQNMQQRRATATIREGQSTDAFKQGMYQTLADATSNPESFRIDGNQSNLIDLVGMLFDFVKEEKRLADPHKDMLTHLQNLYCQVALRDASFFHNTEHPAHLLLNRMVQAGSHYQGETEQKQLGEVIEETVRQALVEYQHDDHVFERLLQQFENQVEVFQQRVHKREQRAVDAARGREKLVFARKHARGFIEVCVKRYGPPDIIRDFLHTAWADVLVFYFLRTGPSSSQWQEKAKVADELARACAPLDREQREAFAARRDMIMSVIQQALEQLGCYSDAEIQRVVQDIQLCQQAVQAEQHEVVKQLNNTLASSMSEADEKELESIGETDEPVAGNASQELVETLKHVRFGTWFEFDAPSRRLKLAWFSPTTRRYMFVDSSGQGTFVKHWSELLELMQKDEARIVDLAEPAPFFERALQAIQRSLKQFASHYISEIRSSKPAET